MKAPCPLLDKGESINLQGTKQSCHKYRTDYVFDTGASDVTLSMVEATFMMKNGYLSKNDVIGNQRSMDANGDVNVGTVINIKNATEII